MGLGTKNVGTHSATIVGLEPGSEYFYRFRSVNASGEAWSGGPISFMTTGDGPPVIEPPPMVPTLEPFHDGPAPLFQFGLESAQPYVLEYCSDLNTAPWVPVDLMFGRGGTMIVPFGPRPEGHYRLRLPE